jgi:hypothetical protein
MHSQRAPLLNGFGESESAVRLHHITLCILLYTSIDSDSSCRSPCIYTVAALLLCCHHVPCTACGHRCSYSALELFSPLCQLQAHIRSMHIKTLQDSSTDSPCCMCTVSKIPRSALRLLQKHQPLLYQTWPAAARASSHKSFPSHRQLWCHTLCHTLTHDTASDSHRSSCRSHYIHGTGS